MGPVSLGVYPLKRQLNRLTKFAQKVKSRIVPIPRTKVMNFPPVNGIFDMAKADFPLVSRIFDDAKTDFQSSRATGVFKVQETS